MKFRITLLMIFVMLSFMACEMTDCRAGFGPDPIPDDPDPNIQTEFEREVIVTYVRDVSKIKSPNGNDAGVDVNYQLYDPNHERSDICDVNYYDGYRQGAVGMTKIGENRFECKIKWVLIQSDPSHKKHIIFIKDPKLYGDGQSQYTSDGISIQNSYDEEIRSYYYYFKQSKIQ